MANRYFICQVTGGFRLTDLNRNISQGQYFCVDNQLVRLSKGLIAAIKHKWISEIPMKAAVGSGKNILYVKSPTPKRRNVVSGGSPQQKPHALEQKERAMAHAPRPVPSGGSIRDMVARTIAELKAELRNQETTSVRSVLVVADVKHWAFDKIYRGLKNNCKDWDIDVFYTCTDRKVPHRNYSVVLFLCDYQAHIIPRDSIPKEKLVLAIRQEDKIDHPIFKDSGILKQTVRTIAASNQNLFDRFSQIHSDVRLMPGGVDTDKFFYQEPNLQDPVRVGWAGSFSNFGKEYRGIPIIEAACSRTGAMVFKPAIREQTFRDENAMVKYYHDEIDIYVDMSKGAGRQNGLIEAASCGVPIISSKVGIAEQLIKHGKTGFLCDRDPTELAELLNATIPLIDQFSRGIRQEVELNWSWKKQAKAFEDLFEEIACFES